MLVGATLLVGVGELTTGNLSHADNLHDAGYGGVVELGTHTQWQVSFAAISAMLRGFANGTPTGPNTGCIGWSEQHIGSGIGQAGPGHAPSIFSGPYSDCSPVAHGDKLALWCYVVNATGATWSYVADTQKNSYGWIPNMDLAGGAGASDHC